MVCESEIKFQCEGDASSKTNPPAEESLDCEMICLSSPPDCSEESSSGSKSELVAAIESLSVADKAKKRKQLVSGEIDGDDEEEEKTSNGDNASLDLNCCFCVHLPERPVMAPCGHNFCLDCFEKWIGQGKSASEKCSCPIPNKMASNPRINSSLVSVIRLAKASKSADAGAAKVFPFTSNQNYPENAFRAKRAKANADCGKILIPSDHFGPILAEDDPVRNQGVLVGELWEDRVQCCRWGVHSSLVSGIVGKSDYGAQSVAPSGGYEDDEDHGDWFLLTGSSNGRIYEDQQFVNMNEALRVSCKFGYPVRVVRSDRQKRSAYAPKEGVRYDGIYRIEKCWQKVRTQGSYKVCRYLFVRCDNEPAPWTSDEHGDRPRPLPDIPELNMATELFERDESPSWDYDEVEGRWKWMKPPLMYLLMRRGRA